MDKMRLFLLIFLFAIVAGNAQSIKLTAGTVTASSIGSIVTVPVTVADFTNIASMTLKIQYDKTVLTTLPDVIVKIENGDTTKAKVFLTNINSQIEGATYSSFNGKITVSWYNPNPANITSGKLFDINFIYNGGTSNIAFLSAESSFSDPNFGHPTATYTNGLVSGLAPVTPSVPVLSSPATGATGVSQSPTLSWGSVAGASSYNLQISTSSLFTTTLVNTTGLTSTSYAASGLAQNTVYYWRVSASNTAGTSNYSSPFNFTTLTVIPAPSAPSIISPSSGATGISLSPTLTWSQVSTAASYNLQISTSSSFTNPVVSQTGITGTSYSASFLSANTKYYWRVSATNTGGTSSYATAEFTTLNVTINPVISIGSTTAKVGDVINVPITASDLTNVSSISLHIQYDPSVLTFNGIYNWSTQFAGGISTANAAGNKVMIGWFAVTPASIANGKLLDLRFTYNGGTSVLSVLTGAGNTEFSNQTGGIISNITYNSGTVSLALTPVIPAVPGLLSPANGASNISVTPVLTWNSASGANSYNVQVSTNSSFTNIIASQNGLSNTSFSVPTLNTNTQYFWRVSATNTVGTSNFSDTWTFTTTPPIPGVPVPASPVNGATNVAQVPILSWGVVSGATSYNLMIATNSAFNSPIISLSNLTNSSYSPSGLSTSTQYYWKVSATNVAGTSAYSTAFSFTTSAPVVPTAAIGSATPRVGDTILVPVNLSYFSNVGAINFGIQYNTSVLKYIGMENWNSQFGVPVYNESNGKIMVAWFAFTPSGAINITSGKMADLKFKYLGGTAPLSFVPADCAVSDVNNTPIVVTYNSGSVSPYTGPVEPAAPVLSSPAAGATGVSLTPVLSWVALTDADTYSLLLATDAAFTNVVFSRTNISGTSVTVTPALSGVTQYFWKVNATNTIGTGIYSETRSFTTTTAPVLTAPVLVSPLNGASGVSLAPTLTWTAVNGATIYNLQIATDPLFQNLFLTQSGISGTSYTAFDLSNNTTFYWRVASSNGTLTSGYSAYFSFNTGLIIPSIPELVTPADNATGILPNTTLTWNPANNAESYNVQVSVNENFSPLFLDKTGIAGTSYLLDGLANNTLYYWRVRATNSVGSSSFSIARKFTTSVALPAAPVLLTPANSATNLPVNVTFTWQAVTAANSYTFQIAENSSFTTNLKTIANLTNTQATQVLNYNTTYFWRVLTINSAGSGAYSTPFSFTTIIAPPEVPVLVTPADNAVKIAINNILIWRSAARAGTYNLKVATDANFTTLITDLTNLTDTTYTLTNLTNSTLYYWKVSATNVSGTSAFSAASSFTTIIAKPSVPVLLVPANNATDVSFTPLLLWTANGATTVNLQVSLDPAFGTTIVNQTGITATSFILSSLAGFTKYYWRVSATNEGGTSDYSTVFNFTTAAIFKISGRINYNSLSNTPVSNVTVKLVSIPGGTSTSVLTGVDGSYTFNAVQAGKFAISATRSGDWGGSNAADALMIGKHFTLIDTLSLLQQMAADVSNNNAVGSSDALLIAQRFTNVIQSFPNSKPEWVFKISTIANSKLIPLSASTSGADTVTISNSDLTVNLLALCAGDANKSYTPFAVVAKAANIDIATAGIKKVSSQDMIEIPVTLSDLSDLGSVSLKLAYPSEMVDYKGIKYNKNITDAVSSESKGIISVSWANTDDKNIAALSNNSTLFTLQFAVKKGFSKTGTINLSMLSSSEVTDINGQAMKSNLSSPQVEITLPENFSLEQNFPNPFNPSTVIKYSVPTKSSVRIKIYNTIGMEVKELVNSVVEAGTYDATFNASNLASGVYLYSIEATSVESGKSFKSVKKMVMLK